MRRRDLLFAAAAAATVTRASGVGAQQAKAVPTIGMLFAGPAVEFSRRSPPFFAELRELGWEEGRNIAFAYRFAERGPQQLPGLAADLARAEVAVIVVGGTPGARGAKQAAGATPIVMFNVADPIGAGLIESLARPGGNVTGLTSQTTDLAAKQLQLLHQAVPSSSRIAVLSNPLSPLQPEYVAIVKAAAAKLGIALVEVEARSPNALDDAFSQMIRHRAKAVLVMPDPLTFVNAPRLIALAARNRLPAMYAFRNHVERGGLISYGASYSAMFRRAAVYVDKILKGAKPADLPVQQPTKFELVINLKTAKALGLTIPSLLLARADEVIQ